MILTIGFSACNLIEPDVICTLDFRSVSVEVTGEALDSHLTIRQSTGDTIRTSTSSGDPMDNFYIVMDDSYQNELEGSEEAFRFVGIKDGNILVDELYEIGADECHIYKVSGEEKVSL